MTAMQLWLCSLGLRLATTHAQLPTRKQAPRSELPAPAPRPPACQSPTPTLPILPPKLPVLAQTTRVLLSPSNAETPPHLSPISLFYPGLPACTHSPRHPIPKFSALLVSPSTPQPCLTPITAPPSHPSASLFHPHPPPTPASSPLCPDHLPIRNSPLHPQLKSGLVLPQPDLTLPIQSFTL